MSNTAMESQTPNGLPLTLFGFGFGFVLAAAAVGTRLAFKRNVA